jgi:hypothetical protein
MITLPRWPVWLAGLALAFALVLMIWSDTAHIRWAEQLSRQGSPPPETLAWSKTGYASELRHFLGTHERGATYRWIALTQDFLAEGFPALRHYENDNAPDGRPLLAPRIYVVWLAGLAWTLHHVASTPLGIAVEQVALWEPVFSQLIAFVAVVVFMGRRYGLGPAAIAGVFFACFPPVAGQFLPGMLTTTTWSLLFACYAIAVQIPPTRGHGNTVGLSVGSALATSLSLWLEPTIGFPTVLVCFTAACCGRALDRPVGSALKWALGGSVLTASAWLIDQGPWSPAAGELRYVHPLYSLAWLGLGVALHSWQRERISMAASRKRLFAGLAAAVLLIAPLVYVQLGSGYKGWLFPSAAMSRLTSLDETLVLSNVVDWIGRGSAGEVALIAIPLLIAAALLAWGWSRRHEMPEHLRSALPMATGVFVAVLVFALFRIRWLPVAALLVLPLGSFLAARMSAGLRHTLLTISVVFLGTLPAWKGTLPPSLLRPSEKTPARVADLEALVHRRFSHWLAAHARRPETVALAPPEFSDSIVFHGNRRVLMSTAWETYTGQIAAARVLSAPESTEAEAVLQGLGISHLVLPSWDPVLPLLVRAPQAEGRDTFYWRLQHWVLPPYLRAIPYHLPQINGFIDQQLPVLKVVFPQDEALSLSRLAEYFVEVERPEPAGLAAQVLAQSFPDDPNAAVARAIVYAHAKQSTDFEREISRLAADVAAGRIPPDWDRRVQRAIVLALGRRHDLARAEITACLADATPDSLYELTPLQAYRLSTLAKGYGVSFPDSATAQLAASLGADYSPSP